VPLPLPLRRDVGERFLPPKFLVTLIPPPFLRSRTNPILVLWTFLGGNVLSAVSFSAVFTTRRDCFLRIPASSTLGGGLCHFDCARTLGPTSDFLFQHFSCERPRNPHPALHSFLTLPFSCQHRDRLCSRNMLCGFFYTFLYDCRARWNLLPFLLNGRVCSCDPTRCFLARLVFFSYRFVTRADFTLFLVFLPLHR